MATVSCFPEGQIEALARGQIACLPQTTVASEPEVLYFIDQHRLMGRGIGYIDAHLLAATALGNAGRLWTRDRRLAVLAQEIKLGYSI